MRPDSQELLDADDFARREVAVGAAVANQAPRRRRRSRICISIIAIGMLNFIVYTVLYAALGGDAHNGERRMVVMSDGSPREAYFVRGHFLRTQAGQECEVSRGLWVYSYLHSISVLVTSAAMIISMLVLARADILATMRDGWISGLMFIRLFGAMVILFTAIAIVLFAWDFVTELAE